MPTHAEKRTLPYTCEQLFDLVVDVERYPEFLPWCLAARVRRREGNMLLADLVIGFKMVRENFTSRVLMDRPDRVDVTYTDGPFRYFNNHWIFRNVGQGSCEIDFYVDFEFRSKVLQKLIEILFGQAVRRMVGAFEQRADAIYSNSNDQKQSNLR